MPSGKPHEIWLSSHGAVVFHDFTDHARRFEPGEARKVDPSLVVVMLTGYGTIESAVKAMREGAEDYITKPVIDEEMLLTVERALKQRRLSQENEQLKRQLTRSLKLENLIGADHRMRKIYETMATVAATRATVLITGESGTGKSIIARAIHHASPRRDKPFVEVNCGALPEGLYRPAYRLTVDEAEDVRLMQAIFERLAAPGRPVATRDAIALLDREPALLAINERLRHKAHNVRSVELDAAIVAKR